MTSKDFGELIEINVTSECSPLKNQFIQDVDFEGKFEDNNVHSHQTINLHEEFLFSSSCGYEENKRKTYSMENIDECSEQIFMTDMKKNLKKLEDCKQDIELNAENVDSDDPLQPLSERWSPLGANYDDAVSPISDLVSPVSELELLSSDSQDKRSLVHPDSLELSRLKNLEDEQELLTSSLMALTSHFAHVQLRVRQIVEAPIHERDQLLKDLEEFAFRGIPDPLATGTEDGILKNNSTALQQYDEDAICRHQFELIERLKSQLSELESIAYGSGAPVLPQHILLEKQKIIIDELKNKLNLKVEDQDLPELSSEELKSQVDNAIGEFVGPLKMKDQLVAQLKTQITDLERFIAFLQCDSVDSKIKTLSSSDKLSEAYNSYAAKKKCISSNSELKESKVIIDDAGTISPLNSSHSASPGRSESLNSKAHGLMDKASVLMQMFATTHFGSKANQFQKNTLKKTSKGNHWGDLRAQLEVDIQEVSSLAATLSFDKEKLANIKKSLKMKSVNAQLKTSSNNRMLSKLAIHGSTRVQPSRSPHHFEVEHFSISSETEEDEYDCYDWEKYRRRVTRNTSHSGDSISVISKELTTAVRKNFAITLQRLMQHGLRAENVSATSSLMVPFMRCLNPSPVFSNSSEYNYRHKETSSFVAHVTVSNSGVESDDPDSFSFFKSGSSRQMHAWELILEYYYLKHGDEYNNTPARKLSQSFNLDIVDSKAVTSKQSLLSAIGMIISLHQPYKRSLNSHFKAFVCAALNSHQLVEWLNLIFSCNDLIDAYYTSSSYMVCTGFRDSLRSIDALTKYDFDLPVDLAVRHFKNI